MNVRSYYLTYWGLMALLLLTVVASYFPLGMWRGTVAMLIAVVKTLLVALYFMHLRYSTTLTHAASVVGILWLSLLIGLSLTDYLTRTAALP